MRVLSVVRLGLGIVATWAAGFAVAGTIVVTFPEFDGPPHEVTETFPQPPLTVGSQTFAVPAGEHIVSAAVSGLWGTSTKPDSTAGVTVLLDGVEVARCEKPDPACWVGDSGQRPWSYTFTQSELPPLKDGTATLTAVQTSDLYIRLGASTLVIETAPLAIVPTLSPLGLLTLLAAVAAAGVLAVKRYPRA